MDKITLKQTLYLMINSGFKKCEIWKSDEYFIVFGKRKKYLSHLIATRKMDMLEEYLGLSEVEAQRTVIMEGHQKINRKNLGLLGKPSFVGTVEELSNQVELWNDIVERIDFKGLFRKALIIVIE